MTCSEAGDFVGSERLLRKCLEMERNSRGGRDDEVVAVLMIHLAITLFHLERFVDAEAFALQAIHIRTEAFGIDSVPVGEALDCLVCIQMRLERDPKGLLVMTRQVLKILEAEVGESSVELTRTLEKMVFLLEKVGNTDEKKLFLDRLFKITTDSVKARVPH